MVFKLCFPLCRIHLKIMFDIEFPLLSQVLLSQVHRLRALDLLGRFLDLGPWAVSLVSFLVHVNLSEILTTLSLRCGNYMFFSFHFIRLYLLVYFHTFLNCYKARQENCDPYWYLYGLKFWLLTAYVLELILYFTIF